MAVKNKKKITKRALNTHIVVVGSVEVAVLFGGNILQSMVNAANDIWEGGALERIGVPTLMHEKRTKETFCLNAA